MITLMKLDLKSLLLATVFILCGCATPLNLDNALAIAPYYIANDGRIIVEARVNDQGPFHFALDTGASISIVFDQLRNKLELESASGNSVAIHGLVASGQFPLVNISSLQVGSEIWADPRIASLPGETTASTEIDGLLGIDFLRRYAVGFSTEDRVLRLYPPDLVHEGSYRGWASIPLERVNIGESSAALYFIEIEIIGKKLPALFDLGTGLNLINWPATRSLRLWPADRRAEELLSGALGTTPVVAQFHAKELRTANIRWQNEVFLVADLEIFASLNYDDSPLGILGSGLFNQRDFVIDFVRNRLLIKVAMDEVDDSP